VRAAPSFYLRTLRLLARRGLAPGVGETAREFAGRVPAALGAAPLARLTAVYERVRFGEAILTPAERADVAAALAELAVTVRARRPA
jgi:hypothetical protein